MLMRWRWISLLLSAGVILTACGSPAASGVALHLAPIAELPEQIRQTPPEVRDAYRFALANRGVLQAIPCYCGCGTPQHGHQSNADCYIDRVGPDGTVHFDPHALT